HATGGMAPYDYKWSNSESEPVLSGLGAGTYTIEVTDVNGCSFSDTFLLEDPLPIAIQFDGQDETAYAAADGNLQAQVSGGSGLFEYTWSDGSTTSGIGPRSPGNYFLTVTDGNGCTTVDSATIMAFQCLLSAHLTVTDASCFGMADGSATLDLAGANEPAPIQWSNGETGTSIEGLPAGAYQVKISDATQCSDSLDFIIKEPAELTLSIDSIRHDNGTQNGSIQASVAGGTPPYSYAWKQGIEIIRTEEDPDGLGTGSYLLVLTDANGCMVTSDTVRIDQTTAIYRDNAFQLRVHPNPTTGLLLIQSTIAFDQVEIYNSFGQLQLKSKLNRANQLNLSSLDPGMYWLKFEKEGRNTFRKVLVVK
ncbi:MAG: T9SS type A sorting domain-containing protein, partial [Saprospiraceae bacterium]|nr:T9SS type A sorting domain-containing protein [Saprospiraceae bacterium]